jgi:hypothetical protein
VTISPGITRATLLDYCVLSLFSQPFGRLLLGGRSGWNYFFLRHAKLAHLDLAGAGGSSVRLRRLVRVLALASFSIWLTIV